jgi:tRNA modification GTPase
VSALTGAGIEPLRAELQRRLIGAAIREDPLVTNIRHARALEQTATALAEAADAARQGLSEELVLEDLRRARQHLGSITGELGQDALYDRIFSTFCIGK